MRVYVAIVLQKISHEGIAWLYFTQATLFTNQLNMHFLEIKTHVDIYSHYLQCYSSDHKYQRSYLNCRLRPPLGHCWAFYFVIFLEQF